MCNNYSGWTNYETWNVKLWIDNDEGSYDNMISLANSVRYHRDAVSDLAEALREWIESENPLLDQSSMYADILNASISSVNWREIAKNVLEDLDPIDNEEYTDDDDDQDD